MGDNTSYPDTEVVNGIFLPGPPYTNPSLQANLVLRVLLGIIALLGGFVPTKLLWKNGEFPATVFCVSLMISNLFFVINAILWPDDNVDEWWEGYGWCDIQVYLWMGLTTIFITSVFEIMRRLAHKVSLSRATSLSKQEKRRENVISALIIFVVPVIQIILSYFLMNARYSVVTLIGCTAYYDLSWPTLVFFILPAPIFAIATGALAILSIFRFYGFERTTRETLGSSSNASVSSRQQRVRRKLYFMCLCIIVPYVPIQLTLMAVSVAEGAPWTKPYNFNAIHYGDWSLPYPQDTIWPYTSGEVTAAVLDVCYIPIIATFPIIFLFGATAEAINTYRTYLMFLGFGRVFPRLNEEYSERRSSAKTSAVTSNFNPESSRQDLAHISQPELDIELGHVSSQPNADSNPWPDLSSHQHAPQER